MLISVGQFAANIIGCQVATVSLPYNEARTLFEVAGKPGVCTIIGGPGVTNASSGIAQAYCDSQPMLVLSGATATGTHGKGWGAIHELDDQQAVTKGITALSAMVRHPEEFPEWVARAFAIFGAARPRPVHLSLPRDILPLPVATAWKTRRAAT